MLLYHYNTNLFKDIRSLALQEGRNNIEPSRIYNHSVSFLFEPIPLDIASILKGRGKEWRKGMRLVEYEVDVNALEANILFHITESPEKTKLLYETQDWSKAKGHPEIVKQYLREVTELEKDLGYYGQGKNNLIKGINRIPKGIRRYYTEAVKLCDRENETAVYDKYAALVPHVMVYPTIPIRVKRARNIVLV